MQTAHKWGYIPDMTGDVQERNWFYLPRAYRAQLVAHEQLQSLTMQIDAWEERQKHTKPK